MLECEHDYGKTICWRCERDGIWSPDCTDPCNECSAEPPLNLPQCEWHDGAPCWCGALLDEPCFFEAHLESAAWAAADICRQAEREDF